MSGESRLYDLEADPGERHDLSVLDPDLKERLLAQIRAHQSANEAKGAPAETADLSASDLEKLRRLGYVEAPEQRDEAETP